MFKWNENWTINKAIFVTLNSSSTICILVANVVDEGTEFSTSTSIHGEPFTWFREFLLISRPSVLKLRSTIKIGSLMGFVLKLHSFVKTPCDFKYIHSDLTLHISLVFIMIEFTDFKRPDQNCANTPGRSLAILYGDNNAKTSISASFA